MKTQNESKLKKSYHNLVIKGLQENCHQRTCMVVKIFEAFDSYVDDIGTDPKFETIINLWKDCRWEDHLQEIEDKKTLISESTKELKSLQNVWRQD